MNWTNAAAKTKRRDRVLELVRIEQLAQEAEDRGAGEAARHVGAVLDELLEHRAVVAQQLGA